MTTGNLTEHFSDFTQGEYAFVIIGTNKIHLVRVQCQNHNIQSGGRHISDAT